MTFRTKYGSMAAAAAALAAVAIFAACDPQDGSAPATNTARQSATPASAANNVGPVAQPTPAKQPAATPSDNVRRITVAEARALAERGEAVIYDVRDERGYEANHVAGAKFVPLDEVAARGLRAKIRCGGDRVPTVEELADFIRGCRSRGLVFKATAGLHHAYPTKAGEHGFLNVLAAVVFGDEEEALREKPPAFALDAASFRWRDREALPPRLADARGSLFHSIGSCSFFEPVEELGKLGML
jgi:hypothetical protein